MGVPCIRLFIEGNMKVICPNHDDHDESLHVYETHSYCFVCHYYVANNEIGVKNESIQKPKADIPSMVRYIQLLPQVKVRGLSLPSDNSGIYLLWPNGAYYKRRNSQGRQRYTGDRKSGVSAGQ